MQITSEYSNILLNLHKLVSVYTHRGQARKRVSLGLETWRGDVDILIDHWSNWSNNNQLSVTISGLGCCIFVF